jgi:hypothetical protein
LEKTEEMTQDEAIEALKKLGPEWKYLAKDTRGNWIGLQDENIGCIGKFIILQPKWADQ